VAGLPKYKGALAPVPSWLNQAKEIHDPPAVRLRPYEFALYCVDGAVAVGAPLLRAFEVGAHFVYETGWGIAFRASNLGGVKASQAWAKAYRKRTGRDPSFYRAHGNVGTGDSQTVIYRGYDQPEDFFEEFLALFVPKPARDAASREGKKVGIADYRLAGERFWGTGDWFAAILDAHYRGDVTAEHPHEAIASQRSLTQDMREAWAQRALGLAVDGKWLAKSRAACIVFQTRHGLAASGEPDAVTLALLTQHNTPPVIV
jgi:hypothetical protein